MEGVRHKTGEGDKSVMTDLRLVATRAGDGCPIGREPGCAAGVKDFELRSGLVGQLGLQQRRHAHYQLQCIVSWDGVVVCMVTILSTSSMKPKKKKGLAPLPTNCDLSVSTMRSNHQFRKYASNSF